MGISKEYLHLVLSLKVSWLRQQGEYSLAELSKKSGLSQSYLNDIERGRKYPSPGKILELAEALNVSYDELISLKLSGKLAPLSALLNSSVMQEIPFEIFGFTRSDLINLMTGSPEKFATFTDSVMKVTQKYGVEIDEFIEAAIRSYKELHYLSFPDIDQKATDFLKGITADLTISTLESWLSSEHRYQIHKQQLDKDTELSELPYIYFAGAKPRLYLNNKLSATEMLFTLCQIAGYEYLGLQERMASGEFSDQATFDQIRNRERSFLFAMNLIAKAYTDENHFQPFAEMTKCNFPTLEKLLNSIPMPIKASVPFLMRILHSKYGVQNMFYQHYEVPRERSEISLREELHFGESLPFSENIPNAHHCRRLTGVISDTDSNGVFRTSPLHSDESYVVWRFSERSSVKNGIEDRILLGIKDELSTRKKLAFISDYSLSNFESHNHCESCPIANCEQRAADPTIHKKSVKRERMRKAIENLFSKNQNA